MHRPPSPSSLPPTKSADFGLASGPLAPCSLAPWPPWTKKMHTLRLPASSQPAPSLFPACSQPLPSLLLAPSQPPPIFLPASSQPPPSLRPASLLSVPCSLSPALLAPCPLAPWPPLLLPSGPLPCQPPGLGSLGRVGGLAKRIQLCWVWWRGGVACWGASMKLLCGFYARFPCANKTRK